MESDGFQKKLVLFCIIITIITSLADRTAQIAYYVSTNFTSETIKNSAFTFLIIRPITNFTMIILYVFTSSHHDRKTNIRNILKFILFAEICYSPGANRSSQTIHEENDIENISVYIIITQKILNTLHIIFISLPQLLIVIINTNNQFYTIDIISLVFSCLFIFWSINYYIICIKFEYSFDQYFTEIYA